MFNIFKCERTDLHQPTPSCSVFSTLSNLPLTRSNFLIKTRLATCVTGLPPFPSQLAEATTLPQPIG